MKLLICSKDDLREYCSFVRSIYIKSPNYKDYSSPVLKTFLYKKGAFCKNSEITPVMVREDDTILAACIYIVSPAYPGVLQVAFFEALEDCQEAVDLIMENAVKISKHKGLSRIVVGLNGHVNYGIGFLCDKFHEDLSFGSSFSPPYYPGYFLKYNPVQHNMVSFCGSMASVNMDRENKILKRIKDRFTCRDADFKNFRREMEIYTYLNNICFKDHPFYFERTCQEDYELFKDLKYFIKEENIIFLMDGKTPIGYLLWYPDFNELIGNGGTIGVGTFIKNKLFSKSIRKFKIVEIAVLPEYQKSGAILALFNELYKKTIGRYESYETSWIFESNFKSKNFGVKWAEKEYKHYTAFEILLQEE